MELNKIHNIDCLEFMKGMESNSVDLILTDPPYGIGEDGLKNHSRDSLTQATKYTPKQWDSEIPKKEIFYEMFRVSKNQIIFGGNYFIEYLKNTSCFIVWDKDNSGDFADCELAWTSFDTAVRKVKFRWNGMLQEDMKNKEVRYHPTQKPVKLFEWILTKYSQPEQIIFDPFLGSGTTAIACLNTNRNYLGCEIDKEYFEIATKRIENQKKINKSKLF